MNKESEKVGLKLNIRKPKIMASGPITFKYTNQYMMLREHTCIPAAAAAAKSPQSCPTLCNPIDSLLPGSSVPGILQARTLEWVAISFSNA